MTDQDDDRDVFESSSLVCDQCGAELTGNVHVVEVSGKRSLLRFTFCSEKCRDEFEAD
jgi:hypothetical protein